MKLKHGGAHKRSLDTATLAITLLALGAGCATAQPAPTNSPDPVAGQQTKDAAKVQTAPALTDAKKAALATPSSAVAPKIVEPDGQDTDRPIWRATHGVLLAVAKAGDRIVAAGDRGIVLLSNDGGQTWKPTKSGTDVLLTGLAFTSPTEGWAVGQDATILHTSDAGTTWTSQHAAPGGDQALFSLAALAPHHLIATGAYALALETTDGTAWTEVKLPNLDEDYHLNCVTPRGDDLVVTGEAGHAFLRHAGTWKPIPVGYEGSQFGCVTTKDGTVLSFGLRGSLFSLPAGANSWKRIDTGEQRSIFGGTLLSDGSVALVGSNGLAMIFDSATGKTKTLPPPTGSTLSGVTEIAGGKWIVVGDDGLHLLDPLAPSAEATGSAVQ